MPARITGWSSTIMTRVASLCFRLSIASDNDSPFLVDVFLLCFADAMQSDVPLRGTAFCCDNPVFGCGLQSFTAQK